MKVKQKLLLFSIGALMLSCISATLLPQHTALAAGACKKDAPTTDPCMDANQKKTNLSPTDFNSAVSACEKRNTASARGGYSFDSQSGNCSNAVASCFQQVLDKRVCTNDTYLAQAADGVTGGDNGELNGEEWDFVIDDVNSYTGGQDLDTNSGTHDSLQDAYNKQLADSKVCDARGSVSAAATCKQQLQQVFNDCYDSLGGRHAHVAKSALDKCIQDKRIEIAQTEEECKAVGGLWNNTTGPITGKRCTPDPKAANNNNNNNNNNNVGGTGSLNTGACGSAKTNLITCKGDGVQALGDVLRQIITILTIFIGIAAVGGIAYSSVLYASAGDSDSQTQQAISNIRNIVIGIAVYGFMIAIINWLIPGGVIG